MIASEDPTVPTPTAVSVSPSGALNSLAIMFTHRFCFSNKFKLWFMSTSFVVNNNNINHSSFVSPLDILKTTLLTRQRILLFYYECHTITLRHTVMSSPIHFENKLSTTLWWKYRNFTWKNQCDNWPRKHEILMVGGLLLGFITTVCTLFVKLFTFISPFSHLLIYLLNCIVFFGQIYDL